MSKINFYFQSFGFLVGMIVGAGMFALPYAFLKAGLFWGLAHLAIALFFILVLHIFYGEIAFLTGGKHRFPGYVNKFLGQGYARISFLITIFSYYGTLLVYEVLGGIFLHNVFPLMSVFFLSVLFFGLGAFLLLFLFCIFWAFPPLTSDWKIFWPRRAASFGFCPTAFGFFLYPALPSFPKSGIFLIIGPTKEDLKILKELSG